MVGTRRPVKKKVVVTEQQRSEQVTASTGTTAAEEASASTLMEEDDDLELEEAKAEERELRKIVKKSTDGARQLVAKCNLEVRKAESALRHEQRLAEERERRWWAAERHKEPPPAYLQLERVYKTIVKGLKAKLELSEARRVAARAEISLEKAKQVQLEVKHAGELRKLCE